MNKICSIIARPQLLGGGPGRGVRQAADWLYHATKGVTLLAGVSGAVSTGNTVVRVHVRRTIITSGGGFRRLVAVAGVSRKTGHFAAIGDTEFTGGMGGRVAIGAVGGVGVST